MAAPDASGHTARLMRSHSVIFSRQAALQDWLVVLQHELGGGGNDGRRDLLPPSAVVAELQTVVSGIRLGHGTPHRVHWRSLVAELAHTRLGFGTQLANHATPALQELAEAFDPADPPNYEEAGRLMEGLAAAAARLRDASLRQAAWDDVLEAFEQELDPEEAGVRLRFLRDLVEYAEDDWGRVESVLTGALNDDRYALYQMGHDLPWRPHNRHDAAGWPLERRLAACRAHLAQEIPRGPLVAWLGFETAFLSRLYVKLGPAELWAGHSYPEGLTASNWRVEGPPPELKGDEYKMFLPEPAEEPWVLMRLDLGDRPSAGAAEHARDLALTVVQLASAGSEWQLMSGCALVREGRWWGSAVRPAVPGAERGDPRYEPTGEYLAELDPTLVQGLIDRLPEVDDVAADVRWAESVRALREPAQRVALAVRLLERRLPDAEDMEQGWGPQKAWTARARWWLRATWAHDRLYADLEDAAIEGVYALPDRWQQPHARFIHFRDLMLPSAGGLSFRVRIDEIIRGLSALADNVPNSDMAARIVRFIASQVADGPAAERRLQAHAERFDVLLRRASRVRNAVLHGNDTALPVVTSVEPLLRRLGDEMIGAQLAALRSGGTLPQVLRQRRDRRWAELERLRAGERPDRVLFTGTDDD
jgi:hypothetical protein